MRARSERSAIRHRNHHRVRLGESITSEVLSVQKKGRFREAEIYLDSVRRHTIACPDPCCLAQGVYIILFHIAYNAGCEDDALHHINDFVRAEPKDIWGLWLRGILLQELWRNRTNSGVP